jgi:hypothetical protein
VDQYLAGETIQAFANTASDSWNHSRSALDRRQVNRHPKGIPQKRLPEVVRSYEAGDSLATIARHESVSPETIAWRCNGRDPR